MEFHVATEEERNIIPDFFEKDLDQYIGKELIYIDTDKGRIVTFVDGGHDVTIDRLWAESLAADLKKDGVNVRKITYMGVLGKLVRPS